MAQAARRRSETANNLRKPPPGKQKVPEPASFKEFFLVLVMYVCKKILLVPTPVKLGIYCFGTSVIALVSDLIPVKKSYFSNKHNFFNQYFVKLGWGWTLSLLLPFVYYTSFTYCCGKKNLIRQHLARLGIGTFWWYVCTKTFNWIENATGMCSSAEMEHYNKKLCKDAGYEWVGFDVSGHAFLLIHCLLVISEEVRCVDGWSKIADIIKTEEEKPTPRMTGEQLAVLKLSYEKHTPRIKAFIIALTILQLLWEVMLLTTILYFHNMPQKLLAAGFAGGVWLLSYQFWYKADSVMPPAPGKGLFRYMKS